VVASNFKLDDASTAVASLPIFFVCKLDEIMQGGVMRVFSDV
jgi:hypothetical protein